MAFDDHPNVDENSKRSEDSVLEVKRIFQRKNGFISREEHPDYGVDLEVELVIDGKHASGKKFPIQIKSTKCTQIVKKKHEKFISLEFPTSRLGYLCHKPPTYGLIVIFDEAENKLYFDYVEEIVSRLRDQRSGDEWKEQDSVNINIPSDNLLTRRTSQYIHKKMLNRHQNHDGLITAHGEKFDIPVLSPFNAPPSRISEESQPKEIGQFLEEYGIYLLNSKQYSLIDQFLSKLSLNDISKSPKLLFLASLTYNRIGIHLEADYYLKKTFQQTDRFSKDEKDILLLTKYHTEYVLGNLSTEEYRETLANLHERLSNDLYKIYTKIRILHMELTIGNETTPKKHLIGDIKNTLNDLKKRPDFEDESIQIFTLFLSFYLFQIGEWLIVNNITNVRIRGKLVDGALKNENMTWVDEVRELQGEAIKKSREIYDSSKEGKNKLVEAESLLMLSSNFFFKEFNRLQLGIYTPPPKTGELYVRCLQQSIIAYTTFLELNLQHEAYKALSIAYEIIQLCKFIFDENLENVVVKPDKPIYKMLQELQSKIGIEEEISIVDMFVSSIPKTINELNFESQLIQLNDEDVDSFAFTLMEALGVPQDRFENIKAAILCEKLFSEKSFCKNLRLLENEGHRKSKETMYKYKPRFIVECRKCQQQTQEGEDVLELLNSINREKCIC